MSTMVTFAKSFVKISSPSGGVVFVFDDYRAEQAAGVPVAVWEAIPGGVFLPICMREKDTYGRMGTKRRAAWMG